MEIAGRFQLYGTIELKSTLPGVDRTVVGFKIRLYAKQNNGRHILLMQKPEDAVVFTTYEEFNLYERRD